MVSRNNGQNEPPQVAVVIPCYNEEQAITATVAALRDLFDDLVSREQAAGDSFLMLVDDGSSDNTWSVILSLHERFPFVKAIRLAHNSGQQMALHAGLSAVSGKCDVAITMDADMQDSPSAIAEMLSLWRDGVEIVYGVRRTRHADSVAKRKSASIYYDLQNSLGLETVKQHSDFRLMSARAVDYLLQYDERNLYLRGIVPRIGLRSGIVEYDRGARTAGESKYPMGKMLSLAIDGITSFSARPMRFIFLTGLGLLIADIAVAVYVLVSYFCKDAISGWSSLMLSVWFLGSLILMAIGIVGEYVGKIYMEVKHRPRYFVSDAIND